MHHENEESWRSGGRREMKVDVKVESTSGYKITDIDHHLNQLLVQIAECLESLPEGAILGVPIPRVDMIPVTVTQLSPKVGLCQLKKTE